MLYEEAHVPCASSEHRGNRHKAALFEDCCATGGEPVSRPRNKVPLRAFPCRCQGYRCPRSEGGSGAHKTDRRRLRIRPGST